MPEHSCCLAIDAMGGDEGPRLVVPAVVDALLKHPQLRCQLHGDRRQMEPLLAACGQDNHPRLALVHADQQVAMDARPSAALRSSRQSSMWQALESVSQGRADACVSAGNTGALMVMSLKLLGPLPGIERPAICTALPTRTGEVYLLDMGANLHCDAEQLRQFAHMATALVEGVHHRPRPRVGLLNVGSETGKGDAVVQEAAALLADDPSVNYQGFVEGDGIFTGNVDIVVCDGFTGNVALKTTEGVAGLIGGMLRQHLTNTLRAKLGAWIAGPALRRLQSRLNPANYNGASLLGLSSTVVKSHGGTTRAGFVHAIDVAVAEVTNNIPATIADRLGCIQP